MRKRIFGHKLSRAQGSRRALSRSLIRAIVAYGAIETTSVKAKILQRNIEKIINLSKRGTVFSRRRVYSLLGNDRKTTDALFKNIATAFSDRIGGYTRITNLPRRRGDAAKMARIEWVQEIVISGPQGQKPSLRAVGKARGKKGEKGKKMEKTTKVKEEKPARTRGRKLIEKVIKRKDK